MNTAQRIFLVSDIEISEMIATFYSPKTDTQRIYQENHTWSETHSLIYSCTYLLPHFIFYIWLFFCIINSSTNKTMCTLANSIYINISKVFNLTVTYTLNFSANSLYTNGTLPHFILFKTFLLIFKHMCKSFLELYNEGETL